MLQPSYFEREFWGVVEETAAYDERLTNFVRWAMTKAQPDQASRIVELQEILIQLREETDLGPDELQNALINCQTRVAKELAL